VSSCAAVPLPISLTLWAVDGVSYITTDRTLLDHAISAAVDKDCRIFRGIQQKQFCIDRESDVSPVKATHESK
jgi:hypothetical protein